MRPRPIPRAAPVMMEFSGTLVFPFVELFYSKGTNVWAESNDVTDERVECNYTHTLRWAYFVGRNLACE